MTYGYCHCCGNHRAIKKHDDLPLCAPCVRKIHSGKAPSISEIKATDKIFAEYFEKDGKK